MKKALSILTVLITVASVAHVSVARHYCHGIAVATKVSLNGEHATCGMEETESNCPVSGPVVDRHCCDDEVSYYGIDNTFVNTAYSAPEVSRIRILTTPVIAQILFDDQFFPGSEFTDTGPPAFNLPPAVDLPVICQFRL